MERGKEDDRMVRKSALCMVVFLMILIVRSANYKWQKELTDRQQRIVEEILGDYLSKYGYM